MLKSSDYYMFDEAGISTDIPLMPEKQAKDYKKFSPYDPMCLTDVSIFYKRLTCRIVISDDSFEFNTNTYIYIHIINIARW